MTSNKNLTNFLNKKEWVISVLKKIHGARRICYMGNEKYIITQKNAVQNFNSECSDVNYYPKDSILVGAIESFENDFFVHASSDVLDDYKIEIEDIYKNKSFHLTPFLIVMAEMILIHSDILDGKGSSSFYNNAGRQIAKNTLEYITIPSLAYNHLLFSTCVALLVSKYDIPDYFEAKDDKYYKTNIFTEWGDGEEGNNIFSTPYLVNEKQLYSFQF
jgi:hypothetical protein